MSKTFIPMGATVLVAADTTAPSGTLLSNCSEAMFYNSGAQVCFVAFGADAAAAAAAAIIPTGTARNSIPILPGTTFQMSVPKNQYVSAIVATTAGSLFVTPGRSA